MSCPGRTETSPTLLTFCLTTDHRQVTAVSWHPAQEGLIGFATSEGQV